jgi:hypothetical protein
MTDKAKTLAEYGHNPKYDEGVYAEAAYPAYPVEKSAPEQHGEAMQRHILKNAKYSERVQHGGNPASGSKVR